MKYLKLVFSAPKQYYAKQGYTPIEGWYLTEKHPTKNAVTGFLGAALGIERGDPALGELKNMITVKYTVCSPDLKTVDRDHHVTTYFDYHTVRPKAGQRFMTVGGTLMASDPNKNCIVKHIEYIADIAFFVYIGAEDENFLRKLHAAIRDPHYPLYFGRKQCMPSRVRSIVPKEFSLLSEEEIGNVYDSL